MRRIYVQGKAYLFTILEVNQSREELIYEIRMNGHTYIIRKELTFKYCKQMDNHIKLDESLIEEVCKILTEVEEMYLSGKFSILELNQEVRKRI